MNCSFFRNITHSYMKLFKNPSISSIPEVSETMPLTRPNLTSSLSLMDQSPMSWKSLGCIRDILVRNPVLAAGIKEDYFNMQRGPRCMRRSRSSPPKMCKVSQLQKFGEGLGSSIVCTNEVKGVDGTCDIAISYGEGDVENGLETALVPDIAGETVCDGWVNEVLVNSTPKKADGLIVWNRSASLDGSECDFDPGEKPRNSDNPELRTSFFKLDLSAADGHLNPLESEIDCRQQGSLQTFSGLAILADVSAITELLSESGGDARVMRNGITHCAQDIISIEDEVEVENAVCQIVSNDDDHRKNVNDEDPINPPPTTYSVRVTSVKRQPRHPPLSLPNWVKHQLDLSDVRSCRIKLPPRPHSLAGPMPATGEFKVSSMFNRRVTGHRKGLLSKPVSLLKKNVKSRKVMEKGKVVSGQIRVENKNGGDDTAYMDLGGGNHGLPSSVYQHSATTSHEDILGQATESADLPLSRTDGQVSVLTVKSSSPPFSTGPTDVIQTPNAPIAISTPQMLKMKVQKRFKKKKIRDLHNRDICRCLLAELNEAEEWDVASKQKLRGNKVRISKENKTMKKSLTRKCRKSERLMMKLNGKENN